jgi:hypothetical protein
MKKIKNLYVDMDGVLSDFNKRYVEVFGISPKDTRDSKGTGKYASHWWDFISGDNFARLDMLSNSSLLLKGISTLQDVQVSILTSSGGFDRHNDVVGQKLRWLTIQGIKYPAVVVPGRRYKARFADHNAFLIDDTLDVIESFRQSGGQAYHYNDSVGPQQVLFEVQQWLRD